MADFFRPWQFSCSQELKKLTGSALREISYTLERGREREKKKNTYYINMIKIHRHKKDGDVLWVSFKNSKMIWQRIIWKGMESLKTSKLKIPYEY